MIRQVEDYPTYDEEHGMLGPNNADDDVADIEIELNEEEPPFLQGQVLNLLALLAHLLYWHTS